MSRIATFKQRLLNRDSMSGTFLKTPHYALVEVFAQSGFDFLCLDAEHAPFDRAAIDQCMAVSRALDFPLLVRVGDASHREILWALDCGAVGIVVPHVETVEMARDIAKSARFGLGGRGYAGSTRWAGYATRKMPDILAQSQSETVVIAQIEEPSAVPLAAEIAALDGIDALFAGPADLSVGLGFDHQDTHELKEALRTVGDAAKAANKGYASFIGDSSQAKAWANDYGVHMFFVGSEHNYMRAAANKIAQDVQNIDS
jgi:2-keto-3-deoxy-L-rhamnonate aldolase RhmA